MLGSILSTTSSRGPISRRRRPTSRSNCWGSWWMLISSCFSKTLTAWPWTRRAYAFKSKRRFSMPSLAAFQMSSRVTMPNLATRASLATRPTVHPIGLCMHTQGVLIDRHNGKRTDT